MVALERIPAAARARSDAAVIVFGVIALVWIGALLGVSFLATPVKFLAPTLTLPVALDVGRQTFQWFNRVELALAVALLASALAFDWSGRGNARDDLNRGGAPGASERPYATIVAGLLLAAVAFQALWLLPRLDVRVEVIIQGGMPPPSSLHDIYVIVEAAKLGALVGGAWLGIAALRARASAA